MRWFFWGRGRLCQGLGAGFKFGWLEFLTMRLAPLDQWHECIFLNYWQNLLVCQEVIYRCFCDGVSKFTSKKANNILACWKNKPFILLPTSPLFTLPLFVFVYWSSRNWKPLDCKSARWETNWWKDWLIWALQNVFGRYLKSWSIMGCQVFRRNWAVLLILWCRLLKKP